MEEKKSRGSGSDFLGATVSRVSDRSLRGVKYLSDKYQVQGRSMAWHSTNPKSAWAAPAQVRSHLAPTHHHIVGM